MKNINKGFTLIELLVVIAVIGLLSAIVLASLASARSRGDDASIKSNATSMKSQAEIFYSNNNRTYGTITAAGTTAGGLNGLCLEPGSIFMDTSTGGLKKFVDAINLRTSSDVLCSSGLPAWTSGTPIASSWAAAAMLSGGTYWCVDSKGVSKNTGSAIAPIGANDSDC